MIDQDEATLHFDTPQQEVKHWKSKVADMQDALRETESSLQDFMESSKELEVEMEREISASNKTISDLTRKNEALKSDVEEWKSKYQKSLAEHNAALHDLHKELFTLRESVNIYKTKLRDVEMDNDELENAERMIASSLADMETRYNKSIERTALLEEELVEKSKLEEDNQRLKDELRDLNEELAILRDATLRKRTALRADTFSEEPTNKNSADELSLADLVITSAKKTPRPSSMVSEGLLSRPTTVSPSIARNPFSQRIERIHAHSRRNSHDVRDPSMTALSSADDSPISFAKSSSNLYGAASRNASGTSSPASRASLRATVRPISRTAVASVYPPSSKAGAGSMRMMQDMMGRMRALETRINSARNLSRVAPEESAIPRPSSRLGSSIGPGGGYNSPGISQTIRTARPSFDGKSTLGSSIPVPANGLSKSTSRRPTSRMSERATPPSVALPRSTTPNTHVFNHGSGSSRGTSPLDFMEHDPAPTLPHISRYVSASAAAANRRRSSVAATLTSGSAPKTRSSTSVGRVTGRTAAAEASAARSLLRSTTTSHRPGSSALGSNSGPPSSWKLPPASRSRSGSVGSTG